MILNLNIFKMLIMNGWRACTSHLNVSSAEGLLQKGTGKSVSTNRWKIKIKRHLRILV